MSNKSIGSNAVSIAISLLPLYPAGVVQDYADGADVWAPEQLETADMVITPDGQGYVFGKNTPIAATLTLAPNSPQAVFLDMALSSQRRTGAVVAEPYNATVVVTHAHSRKVDTYSDGVLTGGDPGMKVGQDRLANKQYKFKFAKIVSIGGK